MAENGVRVSTKYRGKPEYFLAYAELLAAARRRGTVTYREVAFVTGLPLRGGQMAKAVGHLLGEISEDEYRKGRPMLSALAVHEEDGQPGEGFFKLAKLLNKLKDTSHDGKKRFWGEERAAIYSLWRKKARL